MEPCWVVLLNLEHRLYLVIRNTLWMGQDRQLQYKAHMRIFNSDFGVCIGGKYFSDGRCRSISMIKVWRYIVLRPNIV